MASNLRLVVVCLLSLVLPQCRGQELLLAPLSPLCGNTTTDNNGGPDPYFDFIVCNATSVWDLVMTGNFRVSFASSAIVDLDGLNFASASFGLGMTFWVEFANYTVGPHPLCPRVRCMTWLRAPTYEATVSDFVTTDGAPFIMRDCSGCNQSYSDNVIDGQYYPYYFDVSGPRITAALARGTLLRPVGIESVTVFTRVGRQLSVSFTPSTAPTAGPTVAPTSTPTGFPTTAVPTTSVPTTATPTTASPTTPTAIPTSPPSPMPSELPTSAQPTRLPSAAPSSVPTTGTPTTFAPTTAEPTTAAPTAHPTGVPTSAPSAQPTSAPTASTAAAAAATIAAPAVYGSLAGVAAVAVVAVLVFLAVRAHRRKALARESDREGAQSQAELTTA